MSLAISGKKAEALQMLGPLMARGDGAAARCRAFVLALTGDSNGAMVAIDAAMPGSWSRVSPFLQGLPTLPPAQKAAAVNLGIFPDAGQTAYAYNAPVQNYAAPASARVATDRLADIDTLLNPPASTVQPAPPVQVAYAAPVQRQPAPAPKSASPAPHKIWLQLASGTNADALPDQFKRIKLRNRDLMDGITGYLAKGPDRSRLVIGPFRGTSDAQIFAQDLESVGVNAFRWTNSDSDRIVPLATEGHFHPGSPRHRPALVVGSIPKAIPARAGPGTSSSAIATASSIRSPSAACATRPRCSSRPMATISGSA
jgi:hypothetical protein